MLDQLSYWEILKTLEGLYFPSGGGMALDPSGTAGGCGLGVGHLGYFG